MQEFTSQKDGNLMEDHIPVCRNLFYSPFLSAALYRIVYDYKLCTENSELFGVMNIQPRSLSKTKQYSLLLSMITEPVADHSHDRNTALSNYWGRIV
jgi:hypothetical protein